MPPHANKRFARPEHQKALESVGTISEAAELTNYTYQAIWWAVQADYIAAKQTKGRWLVWLPSAVEYAHRHSFEEYP